MSDVSGSALHDHFSDSWLGPVEEPTIAALQGDISRARAWAREHFNADAESDGILDPATFFVEFPDVDRMVVCPKMFGNPLLEWDLWVEYRLAWCNGSTMVWVGNNPITGLKMPELEVPVDWKEQTDE